MPGRTVSERGSLHGTRMLRWEEGEEGGLAARSNSAEFSINLQLFQDMLDVLITDTEVLSRKALDQRKALSKLTFLLQLWFAQSWHLRKLSPQGREDSQHL